MLKLGRVALTGRVFVPNTAVAFPPALSLPIRKGYALTRVFTDQMISE